jgi:hypothetical protein
MNQTLQAIEKFMFSTENMNNNNNYRYNFKPNTKTNTNFKSNTKPNANSKTNTSSECPTELNNVTDKINTIPHNKTISTPTQKDKLFWCFFIILNGYSEYEIQSINSFTNEKNLKIETVEKLKEIKDKLKELKLKRTELEEELVNKPTISLKGLTALCILHNVSITYVYGRKYCIINSDIDDLTKVGVIVQNNRKEDSIKWIKDNNEKDNNENEKDNNNNNEIDEYLTKIKAEYWHIENIQKPLKTPSVYSSAELQDICNKLEIDTQLKNETTGKLKSKTKKQLYDEILQYV